MTIYLIFRNLIQHIIIQSSQAWKLSLFLNVVIDQIFLYFVVVISWLCQIWFLEINRPIRTKLLPNVKPRILWLLSGKCFQSLNRPFTDFCARTHKHRLRFGSRNKWSIWWVSVCACILKFRLNLLCLFNNFICLPSLFLCPLKLSLMMSFVESWFCSKTLNSFDFMFMQLYKLFESLVLFIHLNGKFVLLSTQSKLKQFFFLYVLLLKFIKLLINVVFLEAVYTLLFTFFKLV